MFRLADIFLDAYLLHSLSVSAYIARIGQTCLYETQVPDSTPRASFVQVLHTSNKENDAGKSKYMFY